MVVVKIANHSVQFLFWLAKSCAKRINREAVTNSVPVIDPSPSLPSFRTTLPPNVVFVLVLTCDSGANRPVARGGVLGF